MGPRYANIVCKKADVDLKKRCVALGLTCGPETNTFHRAGELNSDELERIVQIMQNPLQYKIPSWMLNRQKDIIDGKDQHILANGLDSKLREDLERLKKIKAHRGLRHFWGLRVRGQHTKTTGAHIAVSGGDYDIDDRHMQVVAERPLVCRRRSRRVFCLSFPLPPLVLAILAYCHPGFLNLYLQRYCFSLGPTDSAH